MEINWAMAITIMGSFGAASTAQIVSHVLTNRREKKKYERECLQNLYFPVVFRIVEYIEGESDKAVLMDDEEFDEREFAKHPSNPDPIFERIIESVGENLKYAHPNLIIRYQEVKVITDLFKENQGDYSVFFDQRIQLCREFLLEFIRLSNELGTLSKAIYDKLKAPLFFTEFYLLLQNCCFEGLARNSIRHFHLIEACLKPENNFTSRIADIRQRIGDVPHRAPHKNIYEETFIESYQFLHEIIDEFSMIVEEEGEYWRNELEKEWKHNIKSIGYS